MYGSSRYKLSDKQIAVLLRIENGEVRARYGCVEKDPATGKKPVGDNTLFSLEERGLINSTNNYTKTVHLSPFGKQIMLWWHEGYGGVKGR